MSLLIFVRINRYYHLFISDLPLTCVYVLILLLLSLFSFSVPEICDIDVRLINEFQMKAAKSK